MNIKEDWKRIKAHFRRSFSTNLHVSIASVDENNNPTTTPIGSLFLNENQTGFYFEKFTKNLPKNSKSNKNICVLAVNSSKWFWLKSLFFGKYEAFPAIKLYGKLGEKRRATDKELHALKRRVRLTKSFKGHQYLWTDMKFIREISFDRVEKINLGKMTAHL